LCFFRLDECASARPQPSQGQMKRFSREWTRRCCVRLEFCANARPQPCLGQTKGFSPVWTRWCRIRRADCANARPQPSQRQTKGFSPVWTHWCRIRRAGCANARPQPCQGQTKFFLPVPSRGCAIRPLLPQHPCSQPTRKAARPCERTQTRQRAACLFCQRRSTLAASAGAGTGSRCPGWVITGNMATENLGNQR